MNNSARRSTDHREQRQQNDEGPCLECFRSGTAVIVPDLTREAERRPRFVTTAHRSGFTAVQALPMRLRDEVVGALNPFRAAPGPRASSPNPSASTWSAPSCTTPSRCRV
ncbi:GAF domain-containing protein [Streptomyces sp. NPDC048504]|uniref:GAF domain-containing protein n=1 Tax=Streptomyces sp. NPDC048504 TaxID=3365559 RepID=UPI0037186043